MRAPPLLFALALCAGAAGAAEPLGQEAPESVPGPLAQPAPRPDPPELGPIYPPSTGPIYPPAPGPVVQPVPAAAASEPGLSDVRWELAPIRWRGLLAMDLRSFSVDGQAQRRDLVESAILQATSYVYQPWFAQFTLGITGIAAQARGEFPSNGDTLGSNGMLSVFPTSRFPFQANFERTDSRSSEQFTGRDFVQQRAGARQSYRSAGGESNTSAAFDRSTLSSSAFGRDTVDVYNAGYQRSAGANSFDASANRTLNTREAGERSQFDRLFGRHNYVDNGLLSAETLASYGATSQDLATQMGLKNEVTQLSTFATWRRADDDPLFVTGGARLFRSTIASPLSETETRSGMGYGTLNYRVNSNLLLNAGGSVTQISNTGADASAVLGQEFAGATYTTDAHRLGEYLYTANLGANVTDQSGGEEGRHRVISTQGTHGLNRLFDVAPAQSIALNLSQTLAHSHDTLAGDLNTFSNYGGLSYRLSSPESLSGFASVSASDSRTRGFADSSLQLVNFQLSGQANLGRYSNLVANYTVQGTRPGSSEPFAVSRNGGGTYQHLHVFGVAQLRYLAIYERSDYQLNTRLLGDINALREQVTWSFEQRLEYRIGKLEFRLSYRLAEIDGLKNALLFLRIAREFGD
ncbi:MAG TPA: hypothetical protein VKE95_15375 [Burkholderiales bacterium]|nr:hypothetical protein [Burkholderiales bacterium]